MPLTVSSPTNGSPKPGYKLYFALVGADGGILINYRGFISRDIINYLNVQYFGVFPFI